MAVMKTQNHDGPLKRTSVRTYTPILFFRSVYTLDDIPYSMFSIASPLMLHVPVPLRDQSQAIYWFSPKSNAITM